MQLEIRCKGEGIDPEIELSSFALMNIIRFTLYNKLENIINKLIN